jgi:hypothetical protein
VRQRHAIDVRGVLRCNAYRAQDAVMVSSSDLPASSPTSMVFNSSRGHHRDANRRTPRSTGVHHDSRVDLLHAICSRPHFRKSSTHYSHLFHNWCTATDSSRLVCISSARMCNAVGLYRILQTLHPPRLAASSACHQCDSFDGYGSPLRPVRTATTCKLEPDKRACTVSRHSRM